MLTPAIHPHMDMAIYPVLGTIISHGYISSGFLPIRLSFHTVLSCLKGPGVEMTDFFLLESFMDYVSTLEGTKLHSVFKSTHFSGEEQSDIVSILIRFGCKEMPTATNLRQVLIQVTKHEFLLAPVGALYALLSIMLFGSTFLPLIYTSYTRSLMQLPPRSFKISQNL